MLEVNKIHYGDAYELIKLIPDKSVDVIITDPPYHFSNMQSGGKSPLARQHRERKKELVELDIVKGIKPEILVEFVRVLKTVNCYIWCNKKQIPEYLEFFATRHGCRFEILIWSKSNALPMFHNTYLSDKEYCLYFRKGGYCNPQNYDDARTVFYEPTNITDKRLFTHPTIKPLKFIATLIRNSSKPGDLVFDPFMGSGTTAIAATETGRQFIGFENNAKWYKIACDRLNGIDATGQTAFILR
ncbi:MAG: site-specific DNA-methyltransferase [Firmicutes bacterium]|nr:site-specific DNA-methyltransferase [Bacillota bacterium]